MQRPVRWLVCVSLAASACATAPVGPSVMVLPAAGTDFDRFRDDDDECRDWAADRIGVDPESEVAARVARGAVAGAAMGAAVGAAIGAAEGQPATGAAIGAGAGFFGGSVAGGASAARLRGDLQTRYDNAYVQCMYAQGHQVPVARGAFQGVPPPAPYSRRPLARRDAIPPPPPGDPPPPPPDWVD